MSKIQMQVNVNENGQPKYDTYSESSESHYPATGSSRSNKMTPGPYRGIT
jgi:hypothetical protein